MIPFVSDHMVIFTRTFDFLTWLLPVSTQRQKAECRMMKKDTHKGYTIL